MFKAIFSCLLFFVSVLSFVPQAHAENIPVYLFGRDDCGHCRDEKTFLDSQGVTYEYLNILENEKARELFNAVLKKHELPRATPVTVIGANIFQGFDTPETTGQRILEVIKENEGEIRTLEEHLAYAPVQSDDTEIAGCDENGTRCATTSSNAYLFNLPFIGVVDFKSFSLFSLSFTLGTIDGFNPCAMWVLIMFLILLSQIGDKKKMLLVAGVFIFAEAIMYNLILNVWFTTWDFVGLDAVVTPLVGLLAVFGGGFFLYRWWKNRNKPLTCDITDLESQGRTTERIRDLIKRPTTILTVLGIIGVAFSVNVIEFACSIGIPQAYTKILELNDLELLTRQGYILVYTLGYMVDDFIVFGLALWGFSRIEAHGHKYSQISLVIGGVLMLILGALLVFNPSILVL